MCKLSLIVIILFWIEALNYGDPKRLVKLDILRYLLENGANPNVIRNWSNLSVLESFIMTKRLSIDASLFCQQQVVMML